MAGNRTLLLDADSFVYSYALTHQMAMAWTAELWTYKADRRGAELSLAANIESLLEETKCSRLMVALSDAERNYRKEVSSTYKSGRLHVNRPVLYRALREFLTAEYGAVCLARLEGDDLLSMWATEPAADERVMCSIDKDIRGVPGELYNPMRETTEHISHDDAERWFITQTLTGDRTDGYAGCPGLGPKRTDEILRKWGEVEDVWRELVVPAYAKAGLSEGVALENARCARLLRHGEFRESGEVRLWSPPPSPASMMPSNASTAPELWI